MPTYYIHIKGIVQGVGFRPTIYRVANKYKLTGTVSNSTDGVHIYFNASATDGKRFYQEIKSNPPSRAVISSIEMKEIEHRRYDGFEIIDSQEGMDNSVLLTPDFALCDECRREMYEHKNRRFHYPFITCTLCGPRYSIINALPYDRPFTTMDVFTMCSDCQNEYEDIEDRRYFSQTNSCHECGIRLCVSGHSGDLSPIRAVLQAWQQDQIVAIKGIGGYLLTCDATREHAIKKLRQKKHRPSKPLAVMYPDIEILKEDVVVSDKILEQLTSHISPIVLARGKKIRGTGLKQALIAPGLNQIGVMVPYAPLLDLLLKKFGKPIIATSGNLSGDPIEFKNDQAMIHLSEIADLFLHNNRKIVVPQDDSLIALSPRHHRKILLRRSRGMAPTFFNHHHRLLLNENTLSMGGLLKSTFGLITQGNIYISQFLGDTDSYNTQINYQDVLKHLLEVTDSEPDKIICDAHPGFFSTQEGVRLAKEWNVELVQVQHHKAHFAAVLGENDLLGKEESVMGFIWDGVGLGDDRNVWGGETFILNDKMVSRHSHIPLFKYLLGDKMSKEPRLSALALLHSYNLPTDIIEDRFHKTEIKIYDTLLKNYNGVMTSSMGRVFDAVASLILGCKTQTYEGEAAMMLEAEATNFYLKHHKEKGQMSIQPIRDFKAIISKVVSNQGDSVEKRAFQFHMDLVGYMVSQVELQGINKIAFSGGVFQNQLLVDLIIDNFNSDYELYWHQQLSPNDENISFGQLMYDLYDLN